jgi:tRNA(Ile)-lysidine synthase
MIKDFNLIMQISCQLDSTRIILVGVSGGPDSLCLLDLLVKAGYPVVAAHLDHNLRVESGQDSEFVRQKALDYHIRFILATADVMGYARAEGITIEEAARQLRYQFLFQQASEVHAQAVLVGHNADDQVETILMHLLRGSGAAGLMGMPYRLLPNAWSQQIPLVRPLLGVFRSEILTYCQENNLQPLEDISNRDVKFLRNRLRHELLPLLETYNPRFREALLRTASVLQAEDSFIIRETDFAWRKCLQQSGTGYVGLSAPLLLDLPLALQRRIVQRAVVRVRARMQDWDFNMIDQALRFLQHPPATRQADLALGLRLLIEADTLWIAGWEADLPHAMWPQLGVIQPTS